MREKTSVTHKYPENNGRESLLCAVRKLYMDKLKDAPFAFLFSFCMLQAFCKLRANVNEADMQRLREIEGDSLFLFLISRLGPHETRCLSPRPIVLIGLPKKVKKKKIFFTYFVPRNEKED